MMEVSGNPAGLFHVRPTWAGPSDGDIGARLERLIVDQQLCERRQQARLERLTRCLRLGRPLRYRIGRTIAGFGDRVAGRESAARPRAT